MRHPISNSFLTEGLLDFSSPEDLGAHWSHGLRLGWCRDPQAGTLCEHLPASAPSDLLLVDWAPSFKSLLFSHVFNCKMR